MTELFKRNNAQRYMATISCHQDGDHQYYGSDSVVEAQQFAKRNLVDAETTVMIYNHGADRPALTDWYAHGQRI